MDGPIDEFSAFISYSHANQRVARWLHQKLETYRLPPALVGTESPFGPVTRRLLPVFRDRDELPASGDLGEHLRAALARSRYQIVLCTPEAARSLWVNEEILSFKRLHGEHRTLALIVAGEPYAGDARECFPPALRFRLAPDGTLSTVAAEPIAADIRPGKDGRKLALLKLIAGITGARLDALVRRDAARRARRLMWLTGASLTIAVVTIGLAIYAEGQRRVAVRQRLLADRSLNFLIGTFAIANPATENPRTITALSILDRASRRAAAELRDEPTVSARLLRTTGEIYFNLGLPKEAERDLRAALAREPASGEERARTLLKLASVAYKKGDLAATNAAIDRAEAAYPKSAGYAAQLDAEVLERRGMAETLAGHYARSAALLEQAAQKQRTLKGDNREALGRLWMNEAQALVRVQRFAEANRLFAQAVQSYAGAFGPAHLRTAIALQNQGWAFFEQGRTADAEARIHRALAIYGRVLERDHPTYAAALTLLGRVLTARHDPAGALAALDTATGIYTRLYGADNAAVGDTEFYAAEAEAEAGRFDAALTRLARTKAIYDASYGSDDPDQAELLMVRSGVLARAGRRADAVRDCDAALALRRRLDPADPALRTTAGTCAALRRAA
jgi:tetratricopeptide (TPR) repeat protein